MSLSELEYVFATHPHADHIGGVDRVAKEIKINWDSTAEINRLYYMLEDKVGSIPIINAHSVVWAVLDAYCKEGEIIPDDDF